MEKLVLGKALIKWLLYKEVEQQGGVLICFSVHSMTTMYSAVGMFLLDLSTSGSTNAIWGGASRKYMHMRSFDFVLLLHLMHKTMGITNVLCKALQESLRIL